MTQHDIPRSNNAAGSTPSAPSHEDPDGPPRRSGVRRRRLLGAGLGAAATVVARPTSAVGADDGSRPVSMAMHVHSCFSEGGATARGGGGASMMAQLDQATAHGVDVVWWTDHDWRMQGYGYSRRVRFTGSPEDARLAWVPQEEGEVSADHAFVPAPGRARLTGTALRVRGSGSGTVPGACLVWLDAGNSFYSTNLVGTTITLDVLAEQVGPDAELVVQVETSYRPATAGRPAGVYVLEYRVGGAPGRRLESPLVGVVTTAAASDWQTLSLTPVEDVRRFWPDLVAEDSGLARLRFGVRVGPGASASAVFDRLVFDRDRASAAGALRTQGDLVARLREQYPAVTQHLSTEVSMVRHLNVFMPDLALYPYPDRGVAPGLDRTVAGTRTVVDWYQQRGALVQYNHPDGMDPGELVDTRALGTDLMEIGSPRAAESTERRIALFDVAARNAVFLTATSQLDDHAGRRWTAYRHFWLTSVWAASTGIGDLLDALRSGAVWWWERTRMPDATLDVRVAGRRAMGQVCLVDDGWVDAEVSVTGLPAGARLVLVTGVCDRSGATTPSTTSAAYAAADLTDGAVHTWVRPGTYLRPEVRDADGALLAFGNPLWVLDREGAPDVPEARRFRWDWTTGLSRQVSATGR